MNGLHSNGLGDVAGWILEFRNVPGVANLPACRYNLAVQISASFGACMLRMLDLLLFGLTFGCSEPAADQTSPFHGDWKVVAMLSGHESAQPDELDGMKWRIQDAKIFASQPGESGTMSFKISESSTHKEIDIIAVEGGIGSESPTLAFTPSMANA